MFINGWRRSQKPRWRVEAHTTSYDHQILRLSRSVDDKAVLVVCVVEIQAGSREFAAARVRVPEAVVCA